MNQYLILAICMIAAYLFGCVLFAMIVTKLFTGKDIRSMGNTNPGTSNVMRSVGPVAGVLTAILDIAKALIPIIVARILFFGGETFFDWIALYLIGMSVILGHCRPFWNGFKKGGGGMGSAVGLYVFFVPFEFAASLLIAVFVVFTFMKKAEFKFGRWAMIIASVVSPFIVLITSKLLDIPLFFGFSIGGHSTGIIVGSFLLLIELFFINSYELFHWMKHPNSTVNPERKRV